MSAQSSRTQFAGRYCFLSRSPKPKQWVGRWSRLSAWTNSDDRLGSVRFKRHRSKHRDAHRTIVPRQSQSRQRRRWPRFEWLPRLLEPELCLRGRSVHVPGRPPQLQRRPVRTWSTKCAFRVQRFQFDSPQQYQSWLPAHCTPLPELTPSTNDVSKSSITQQNTEPLPKRSVFFALASDIGCLGLQTHELRSRQTKTTEASQQIPSNARYASTDSGSGRPNRANRGGSTSRFSRVDVTRPPRMTKAIGYSIS